MAAGSLHLSKSRYTAGLQCEKLLWWSTHEPDAPELNPDGQTRAILDQGARVGRVARDYVPGGVLIDLPHTARLERVAATRAALDSGAPAIYEASFFANDVFVAVDILERQGGAFTLIEVKSSTRVKEEHVPDAAVQAFVLRQSGLEVRRVQIMHLDRTCVFPDLTNLFLRVDVTAQVERLQEQLPERVRSQLAMLARPLPEVETGDHCSRPYRCPFHARCWEEQPAHHVSTLHYFGKRASRLIAQGYTTIFDLPEDLPLPAATARQVRAVRAGRMVVEASLAEALLPFESPITFLDFETVQPAIPLWNGCRPYDQIPVQFSCHVEQSDGAYAHHAWLAEGAEDPRPAFADQLIRACANPGVIVTYNASFETSCLDHLARCMPDRSDALHAIRARIVDLLPVLRNHVYHPDFGGRFGLKAVLPALVPELSYEGLAIGGGTVAMQALGRLLLERETLRAEEQAQLRKDLLTYCELDTWAMVQLLERLRALARDSS